MCNTSVVKTGSSIRLSVGFPEGYGADTPGVVYKAYHFIKGPNGEIADVEEIGCVVTQYGLVIACKSFSPYAVVAVEDDDNAEVVKRVLFLNSAGGEVEGEKIIELRKSQPDQVVTVKAKEGYYLSSVNLSGQELPITDSRSMSIPVDGFVIAEPASVPAFVVFGISFCTGVCVPDGTVAADELSGALAAGSCVLFCPFSVF